VPAIDGVDTDCRQAHVVSLPHDTLTMEGQMEATDAA